MPLDQVGGGAYSGQNGRDASPIRLLGSSPLENPEMVLALRYHFDAQQASERFVRAMNSEDLGRVSSNYGPSRLESHVTRKLDGIAPIVQQAGLGESYQVVEGLEKRFRKGEHIQVIHPLARQYAASSDSDWMAHYLYLDETAKQHPQKTTHFDFTFRDGRLYFPKIPASEQERGLGAFLEDFYFRSGFDVSRDELEARYEDVKRLLRSSDIMDIPDKTSLVLDTLLVDVSYEILGSSKNAGRTTRLSDPMMAHLKPMLWA